MAKIYEIYGFRPHQMTVALMEAANAAALVPKGGRVALKPNLVTVSPPEEGATTHAGVLSGAIEYLQAHGIANIEVIEGSWVGARTGQAMKAAGYHQVCEKYGVPFYDLKQDSATPVKTPFGPIAVCDRARTADLLINLPVLKGHCQTVMTCALKNCKGCIPDREKRRFHSAGLTKPIAALACALRPGLTIVDSICGDLDFEEGGNPVQTGRMFLGTDPVQLDAYGCRLMGLDLREVPYIGLAEQWGGGSARIDPGDIVSLNDPSQAGTYPKPSGKAARLAKNIREKDACSACYAALVRALHTTGGSREAVAIGQGWHGKPFDGLGIGRCCDCAARQVKGCPPTAEEIAKALKNREEDDYADFLR